MPNEDWDRLARVLEERIEELNLTQTQIQNRGGPSPAKVREIINRRSTSLSASKRRDLERAIGWQTGSIDEVLNGGEPSLVKGSSGLGAGLSRLLAPIDTAIAEQERSRLADWVTLSFRADDVDGAIPSFAPEPDSDQSEIGRYLDEVGGLINAAEDLTDAVHKAVLDAFGGDVAKLRQMKREIRRANLAKQGLRESLLGEVFPLFDEDDMPRGARRIVAVSLTGPDRGELRVFTHEESKSIPSETYDIVCAVEPGASDEAAIAAARVLLRSRDPDKAYNRDNTQLDDLLSRPLSSDQLDATVPEHDPYGDKGQSERQLLDERLVGLYIEMYLRAIQDQGVGVLREQARDILGDDSDASRAVTPEIENDLYVRYIAARHSAIQGGSPEVHAATDLTPAQQEAAAVRYRRERSEMILFDGHIRTLGSPADVIAEAIHRATPADYRKGRGEHEPSGDGKSSGPD